VFNTLRITGQPDASARFARSVSFGELTSAALRIVCRSAEGVKMPRVDRRRAHFGGTRGEPICFRPRASGRAISLFAAAIAPFIPSTNSVSKAQTWVNPNTGSWSVAGNWVGGVVPVSASGTQLVFSAGGAESYTAFNDIAIPFTLNRLTLNNNGSD